MITIVQPEPKRSVRIRQLSAEGMRPCDIARALGCTPNLVNTTVWAWKKRDARAAKAREAYAAGKVRYQREEKETPKGAQARIAREVAEGMRCRVCWLLVPCADHQP